MRRHLITAIVLAALLATPVAWGAANLNNSTQYFHVDAPLTDTPFTVAIRSYMTGTAYYDRAFSLGDAGTVDDYWSVYRDSASGDAMIGCRRNSGINKSIAAQSKDSWYIISVSYASSTSRIGFLDGGNKATSTTSCVPISGNVDKLYIGSLMYTDPTTFAWGGRLAFPALWSEGLADDEQVSYGLGFDPRLISPDSLVSFWMLTRSTTDAIGNYDLTAVASPAEADNPRIFLWF